MKKEKHLNFQSFNIQKEAKEKKQDDINFSDPNLFDIQEFEIPSELNIPNVPIGLDICDEEGLNLNEFISDKRPQLADHSWFEDFDPEEQLNPKTPNVIQDLERFWGKDPDYGPVNPKYNFRPSDDRFDVSIVRDVEKAKKEVSNVKLQNILQKAVRLASDYSVSYEEIHNLLEEVKNEPATKRILNLIKSEKIFLGTIYIKAAAYPECFKGDWKNYVKEKSPEAKYIVSAKKCLGCPSNRFGRCAIFNKDIVKHVPWEKVVYDYEDSFKASNSFVVGSSPKETIRKSIIQKNKKVKVERTEFYDFEKELPTTSKEKAIKELEKIDGKVEVKETKEARYRKQLRKDLNNKIASWYKRNFLTKEEVKKLLSLKDSPQNIFKTAKKLIQAKQFKEERIYQGIGSDTIFNPSVSDEIAYEAIKTASSETKVLDGEEKSRKQFDNKIINKIASWKNKGLLSNQEAIQFINLQKMDGDKVDVLDRALKTIKANLKERNEYSGQGNNALPSFDVVSDNQAIEEVNSSLPLTKDLNILEQRDIVAHTKKLMNNGFCGERLIYALNKKYSKESLSAAENILNPLIKKQAGVAGYVYIDPEAYDQPKNTKGCDLGAQIHKTASVKNILGMDKCRSCTFNNMGTCMKYKRKIIAQSSLPRNKIASIQNRNIENSKYTETKIQPNNVVEEFELRNNNPTDNISLYSEKGNDDSLPLEVDFDNAKIKI